MGALEDTASPTLLRGPSDVRSSRDSSTPAESFLGLAVETNNWRAQLLEARFLEPNIDAFVERGGSTDAVNLAALYVGDRVMRGVPVAHVHLGGAQLRDDAFEARRVYEEILRQTGLPREGNFEELYTRIVKGNLGVLVNLSKGIPWKDLERSSRGVRGLVQSFRALHQHGDSTSRISSVAFYCSDRNGFPDEWTIAGHYPTPRSRRSQAS